MSRTLATSFKVAPRALDAKIVICNFGWQVSKMEILCRDIPQK